MALVFQVDDKGHLGPKLRCDNCGVIIENYADGVALPTHAQAAAED